MTEDIQRLATKGGGQPPGFEWSVDSFQRAKREAKSLLKPCQIEHVKDLISELAREKDPTHSNTSSVDAVEDFFELRDKGGILGKLNLRVYFGLDKDIRTIVVLGVDVKKNDGPMKQAKKVVIRRRWRNYMKTKRELT